MLNQVCIGGRLTKDVELRRTGTGKPVASFTLAVDRDGDGCDFIDVVAWERTAEHAANYFYKGKVAIVTGRLQIREWTDKNGNKRRNAEIVASRIYFCDKKEETKPSVEDFASFDADDDAIPF